MPIVFAGLVGLLLGAALAWFAAPLLTRNEGPVVMSRTFSVVLAFAAFVWLPVVGYFVAFHPDWSYLYLVPHRQVPSAIDLVLVLMASGTVVLGFWAAVVPVRRRRVAPVLALIGAPAGLLVGALPFTLRRLAVSGTYAQFHGDFGTEPIGSSLLGKGVLLMGIVFAAGVGWTLRSLARIAAETAG